MAGLSVEQAARLFQALSDGTRLRLLQHLAAHGEVCVHELVACAGVSQPAVSHHLMLLRGNRLVESRRQGQRIAYRITSPLLRKLLRLTCGP